MIHWDRIIAFVLIVGLVCAIFHAALPRRLQKGTRVRTGRDQE